MKKLFIYAFLCSTLIYSQNEENQILKKEKERGQKMALK